MNILREYNYAPRTRSGHWLLSLALFVCGVVDVEALEVSGFSPDAVEVGDTVTVSGTGLDAVRSARLGGVAVVIADASPTQLQFAVPTGASTGLLELGTGSETYYGDKVLVVDDGTLDLDGDGLPDSWERQFLGGTSAEADADADGDGYSNLAEWVAGTHPSQTAAALAVSELVWKGDGALEMAWASVAGKSYVVQYRKGLREGQWSTLAEVAATDTLARTTLKDFQTDGSAALGFFRIVTPPPGKEAVRAFQVRAFASPPGAGSFAGAGTYAPRASAEITAQPAAGYLFEAWSMGLAGTDTAASLTVQADTFVVARFRAVPQTADEYRVATRAVPARAGEVRGGGTFEAGAKTSLEAVAFSSYQFHRWEGDLSGTQNPVPVTADRTRVVTARFIKEAYAVGAVASPLVGGTVNGAGNFKFGEKASLTAFPADTHVFTGWSGAASGTENPLSLVVVSDSMVTANFALKVGNGHLVQAASLDTALGSVSGAGAHAGGATAVLTATAAPGQAFVQWTGADTSSTNPLSIQVDGGRSLQALFAPETFAISLTSDGPGTVSGGGVFVAGSKVTLSASPLGQSRFTGWSGDLESTEASLELTIDKPLSLKATFESAGGEGNLVLIPGGKFTMGDSRKTKGPLGPTHQVEVSSFYLGKYEVTKKEWDEVHVWALKNGYDFTYDGKQLGSVPVSPGDEYPIVNVTWYDIAKWCNARSEKEGLTPAYYTSAEQNTVYRSEVLEILHGFVNWEATGYRLPTEVQWEFAARGGLSGKLYPSGDTLDESSANYNNSVGTLTMVGAYPANGYGLHDMAGNVFEACWDWYGKDWYAESASKEKDTTGPRSGVDGFNGNLRIVRGGSYRKALKYTEVSYRGNFNKTWKNYAIGFRVAVPKLVAGSAHGLAIQVSPPHAGTVTGAGSFAAGMEARIKAVPAAGFIFVDWSGGLDSTDAQTSVRMDGSKRLTASFVPSPAILDDDADGLSNAYENGVGRYEAVAGTFTWQAAAEDARQRSGHLATLVDKAESAAVLEVLGGTWPADPLWLGAQSPAGQGWAWDTGEPWAFTNWTGNPPDSSAKDRVLQFGAEGTWEAVFPQPDDARGYLLEIGFFTDAAKADTDADGLTDRQEIQEFGTLPNLADTDGDGLSDGAEVLKAGSLPLVADTDADGFSDHTEQAAGSDPASADSMPSATLSGTLAYAGTMTGKVHLDVGGYSQVLPAVGAFSQAGLATGQFHKLTAWMDVDADGVQDAWEPRGEFTENPFSLAMDRTEANTTLHDPDNDGDGLTDIYEMGRGRYKVVNASFFWEEARDDAASKGGHLATISSLAEWEAVRKYAADTFPRAGAKYDLWIGGHQPKGAPDQPWQWVTGEPWAYQRWMPEEPSATSGQHDSFLYVDSGGADNSFLWKRGTPFNASNRYLLEFGDFTDPAKADTDGDGLSDGDEANKHKSQPLSADSDGDGLSDGDEANAHRTNLLLADTDGDSFSDGDEVAAGSDPLDKASYPAGNISGTIAYDGVPRGTIYISTGSRGTALLKPGKFVLSGMTTGKSYDLWAFRDVNGNSRQDPWEPAARYPGNPIFFKASLDNIDLALADPDTDGDGLADSWEMGYLRYSLVEGENFTWEQAQTDAATKGGHLATILSEAEWDAISQVAGPEFPPVKFEYSFLIGGYRDKGSPDNPWKWATGETWGHTRWADDEPSADSGQHAAYTFAASDLDSKFRWWRGSPFNTSNRYLLEKGYFTDPAMADTDGDGLSDGAEVNTHKSIPTLADSDSDGLTDGDEVAKHKTKPTIADTDGDGFNDGDEVAAGTSPLDGTSYPAANITGTIDYDGIPRGTIYITTGARGTAVLKPGKFVLSSVATGKSYDLWAFRDVNGNARQDNWEPVGTYAQNPINLKLNLDGITITLADPDNDGDGLTDSFEMGFLRYEMVTGAFSWDAAKADAQARGGHLATLTTETEWAAAHDAAAESFPAGTPVYNFWIGGFRPKGDPANSWQWVTGEKWSYQRWLPDEPVAGTGQHDGNLFVESGGEEKSFLWKRGYPFNTSKRYLLERGYPTDPAKADTDGDGFNDGDEYKAGTDSLDPASRP